MKPEVGLRMVPTSDWKMRNGRAGRRVAMSAKRPRPVPSLAPERPLRLCHGTGCISTQVVVAVRVGDTLCGSACVLESGDAARISAYATSLLSGIGLRKIAAAE